MHFYWQGIHSVALMPKEPGASEGPDGPGAQGNCIRGPPVPFSPLFWGSRCLVGVVGGFRSPSSAQQYPLLLFFGGGVPLK